MGSRQTFFRRHHRLVVTALVLAATSTGPTALLIHHAEPRYQGHSLSEWITPLSVVNTTAPDFHWTSQGATQAVLHAGAQGLPFLASWVSYQPRYQPRLHIRRLTWSVMNLLPPLKRITPLVDWIYQHDPREARRDGAARAFHILGPAAAPAIPELLKTAALPGTGNEPQSGAAFALAGIGPAALPALVNLANNESAGARLRAIRDMGYLGTNGLLALPFLLTRLKGTNEAAAEEAAAALGALHLEPDEAVPALVQAFHSTNETLRFRALYALREYHDQARPALPYLLPELKTSDRSFREEIATVINEIAPEVLTNAPPAQ